MPETAVPQSISLSLEEWVGRPPVLARGKPVASLLCFPFAGGGASLFRDWQKSFPDTVQVIPVQLPGRESRFLERPFTNLRALVETLASVLKSLLEPPFALFGHSMGAYIAFELARELRRQAQPSPIRLFVSGCRAPQVPDPDPPLYQLSQRDFLGALDRLNGVPEEVLGNAEFMELMTPMLRADFELCDTYVYQPGPPLGCPISAFAGSEDGKVRPEHVTLWRNQTAAGFTERVLPGDHFFLTRCKAELLGAITADLSASAS
jgi:medium-chain acyl-[acyl-carrier-protein] hydrolase